MITAALSACVGEYESATLNMRDYERRCTLRKLRIVIKHAVSSRLAFVKVGSKHFAFEAIIFSHQIRINSHYIELIKSSLSVTREAV